MPPRKKRRRHRGKDPQRALQYALYPCQVWSYDFVHDKCRGGAKLKLLCVNDEFTRQCHAVEVGASLTAQDVQKVLLRLFTLHGAPTFLRSDNGPEFVQTDLQRWLAVQQVQTLYIEPGSPCPPVGTRKMAKANRCMANCAMNVSKANSSITG